MPTAVISGTSRGLGHALVEEFARAGWNVIALSRAGAVGATAGVQLVAADVAEADVASRVRAAIGKEPVDLLVNNAAVGADIVGLEHAGEQDLLEALNVNVVGPFRLTKALLPNLLRAPQPLVINVSTRLASLTRQARGDYAHLRSSYAYRVSKAAQNMLTVSVAGELSGRVRCWAIHPGALLTGMALADAAKSPAEAARQLRELVETPCVDSPRFVSLGEGDIEW